MKARSVRGNSEHNDNNARGSLRKAVDKNQGQNAQIVFQASRGYRLNRQDRRENASVLEVVGKGKGAPLEPSIQQEMSRRFVTDFSKVRIHTDAEASESARAVDARAYTVGHEIVFSAGAYSPKTAEGKRTLVHELTHVIQQRQGPVDGTKTKDGVAISDPSDHFEQAASANAVQVMRQSQQFDAELSAVRLDEHRSIPVSSVSHGPAIIQRQLADEDRNLPDRKSGEIGASTAEGLQAQIPGADKVEEARIQLQLAEKIIPRPASSKTFEIVEKLLDALHLGVDLAALLDSIAAENVSIEELAIELETAATALEGFGGFLILFDFLIGFLKIAHANAERRRLGNQNGILFGKYAAVLYVYMNWTRGFGAEGPSSFEKLNELPTLLRTAEMSDLPGVKEASGTPGFDQGVAQMIERLRAKWVSDASQREGMVKELLKTAHDNYAPLSKGHRALEKHGRR